MAIPAMHFEAREPRLFAWQWQHSSEHVAGSVLRVLPGLVPPECFAADDACVCCGVDDKQLNVRTAGSQEEKRLILAVRSSWIIVQPCVLQLFFEDPIGAVLVCDVSE